MSIFSVNQRPTTFSNESPSPVDEHPHALIPPFTSGVGTLIEEERELLRLIQDQMENGNETHSFGLQRILCNHVQEIQEIIALLEQYSERLPIPQRFEVLKAGPARHLYTALPTDSAASLLSKLTAEHRRLFGNLEQLRKSDHESLIEPGVLSKAAQRHEDMAWMLTALQKEDERPSDAGRAPDDVSELKLAEENWNNDGGQQSPSGSAPAPDHLPSR